MLSSTFRIDARVSRKLLWRSLGAGANQVQALGQIELDRARSTSAPRRGCRAPEHDVHVPLEDLGLGQPPLEFDREQQLLALALQRAVAADVLKQRVLDHLRGDRRATAALGTEELLVERLRERRDIEPVVIAELVGLVRDDRLERRGGHRDRRGSGWSTRGPRR